MTTETIATGTSARLGGAISLADGDTIQVAASAALVGDERVYLLFSVDGGTTYQKVADDTYNGVVLNKDINRNSVSGPGTFKLGITDTESATIVYYDA